MLALKTRLVQSVSTKETHGPSREYGQQLFSIRLVYEILILPSMEGLSVLNFPWNLVYFLLFYISLVEVKVYVWCTSIL